MQTEIKSTTRTFSGYADRPLVAGDKEAYYVACETDGAEGYILVRAKRADGITVQTAGNSATEGRAICLLTPEIYAVPGELLLRVQLVSGNQILTVKELHVTVLESI